MDNAQKAIMIGVGLFITIIIISAVLLVVNLGSGLMGDATSELGSISGSLRAQILDNWSGKVKSGSEVLAFVRQYANSDSVAIVIEGGEKDLYVGAGEIAATQLGTKANYTAAGITDATLTRPGTTSNYSAVVSSGIISETAYYVTAVCYDSNDNVIGVAIIKQ